MTFSTDSYNSFMQKSRGIFVAVVVAALVVQGLPARACPFCSAVSLTFSQEIAQSETAVIAKLVAPPAAGSLSPRADGPLPKGTFAVVEVLKGAGLVDEAGLLGPDAKPIETIMLEEKPVGALFLLMGIEPPKLIWSSPIHLRDKAVGYLRQLADLPAKGPDRLAFFQKHLEDPDETLARDAYDEFAVAPYEDVRGLESRMDPTQLLAWIENPKVPANRRRLYATMLGVCGTKADADRIGTILTGKELSPDQAEVRSGLDAIIACYVTLKGPEGLDLVDELFLKRAGKEVPFTETYAAVMALRFLGEESDKVPRQRVLESLRLLLQEPKLADLVVADLARWQDWSAIDRLAELFEKADADTIFVREPVVNYLKACPLPEAAVVLARLEKIDPEAVRRAATLAGFAGAMVPAVSAQPSPPPPTSEPAAGGLPPPLRPDDGDPGDPASANPLALPPTSGAVSANPGADAALAARIAPVLADEDATDNRAAFDPSQPPPPERADGGATAGRGTAGWMASSGVWWAGGIGLLLLLWLSRGLWRSGGS
jgi:hypothetical protein